MKGFLAAAVLLALAACDNSELPTPPKPPAPPAGPKIVVTTLVREFDPAAAKHDASWVAVQRGTGPWTAIAPVAPGTYELDAGEPWAIAIACSDEDDAQTSVTVHRRTAATTVLEHVLERQCSGIEAAHTLTGTLRNLPPASGWFDFGYVDEARGVAIPGDSDRASYELVRVYDGTWDLAFGVRGSPGTALTRVALLRSEVIATDHTLDVDLAGPASFVPGTKALVVRGMTAQENLEPIVRYTAGGAAGLDVGPPDVPSTVPDVSVAYATFPPEIQRPNDRYRGTIRAKTGKETAERTVRFAFARPLDVDVTLPAVLAPPEASLAPSSTAVVALVRAKLAATAGAGATYRVTSRVRLRARQDHRWTTTFDAQAARDAIDDTMPDLSSVPGFHSRWALARGEAIEITASVTEAATPLGDGTAQRTTSSTAFIEP